MISEIFRGHTGFPAGLSLNSNSNPLLMEIFNRKQLKPRRQVLRNYGTSAEATLWLLLKGKQLDKRKFRRQHSVGPYILDFYCPQEKLAVELDGEQHFTDHGKEYDARRTKYINDLGILILRFENCDVFDSPQLVLNEIRKHFRGS
jgi:very-short-patch-repair endonuclease